MYIWWVFLLLAYKTVADQSGSELITNGGKLELWSTDRVDQVKNVLLNLSDHIEITRLHGEIRNVQDNISVIDNTTKETITNRNQEMDPKLKEINVQTDNLYMNLINMMKQEINATFSEINMRINNLYTNLTDMVKQKINATSKNINMRINKLYMNVIDMMKQEINATSSNINMRINNLYTNLTDIVEQEINATSSNINIGINNLDTNLTNRTEQSTDVAQHNIFPDDATIDNLISVNDHVKIQVADPEAFHTSVVQQREQAIENRSYRSTIESWQPDSIQQLAKTIKAFSKGKSLIDRHWIIFYWIVYNIKYDTVSFFSKNYEDQSAEGVFRTKKGVCAGYANLYKYLCDQLQMPCEIVSGYSKGYGFDTQEGALTEANHAWNAVEIDRHWYLIDSTWGAGHLDNTQKFKPQLKTHYFLSRPNEMIYDHLPEDEKWQLLRTPIKMAQYMQMPKVHPAYFELKLELASPRNQAHVDLIPGKPYALVLIRAPSDVHLIAELKLNHQNIYGGDYVVFDNKKQVYCCYFAPSKIGKHQIIIYGKQEQDDTESDSYRGVLTLTLDVKQMPSNPISFPKTWKNFFDLGLEIISPQHTHLIRLNNGTTHTQIQIKTPDNVQLIGLLKNEQGQEVIGGDHVYYDRHKNIWRCKFAPDQDGLFEALIMAKQKSAPGSYTSAVSFKIDAKQIPLPPLSYPETWQLFHDLDMKIETPRNQATITLSKNQSEVEIHLKTPDNVDLLGRLSNNNEEKVEHGHQVFYDQHTGFWRCKFAPNEIGMFKAIIMAKKKSDSGYYTFAVSFNIEVKQIPLSHVSYPYTSSLFYDLGLKIEAPRNQAIITLSKNQSEVEIHLKTPDNVDLLGRLSNNNEEKVEHGHQVFYDQHTGFWRCKFAPNEIGMFKAIIMAKKKSDPGHYKFAVSFNIEVKQIPSSHVSYPYTSPLFYDLGLKIEAPRNRANAVWPDNASYAEVLIQAPDKVEVSSSIEYQNNEIKDGSLAQYDNNKKLWQLLFAPEREGPHELIVFAKRTDGNESSSKLVVKFNLNVTKLQQPMKFPLIYSQFQTKKCRIYTPIDGILKKGSVVSIYYVIPGAIDVNLVVDSQWLKSEGYTDPILQRQITVGSKAVTIYAKYEGKSYYNNLVTYTVQ